MDPLTCRHSILYFAVDEFFFCRRYAMVAEIRWTAQDVRGDVHAALFFGERDA